LANWQAQCLRLLRREGVLPASSPEGEEASLSRFTFRGSRATFGNVAFLRERFSEIFGEIAGRGRFAPRHLELINAALSQARGMRFRLERRFPARRDEEETVLLRPQTFDLDLLLHFAAARFLSGLDPRRLRRCPQCGALFLLEAMRRKRFCTPGCRSGYHNRVRVETGRQALYMRRRRERIRRRAGAGPSPP